MLCKITFQLQNVFSNVFSVFCFVFCLAKFLFFASLFFGYVIVMVFQSKFIKCKFIHFVFAPQSWGVSGNGHNQISLSSLHFHFSLYFHHLIFHLTLPPSLTFPFPPCIPGCCRCKLSNVSIFSFYIFAFDKYCIFFFLFIGCHLHKTINWSGLHMDSYCPLSNPFRLELHQCYTKIIMKPNSWERVPSSLCLCDLNVIALVHMFCNVLILIPISTLMPCLNEILQNQN